MKVSTVNILKLQDIEEKRIILEQKTSTIKINIIYTKYLPGRYGKGVRARGWEREIERRGVNLRHHFVVWKLK